METAEIEAELPTAATEEDFSELSEQESPIQDPAFVAEIPDKHWNAVEEDVTAFIRDELARAEGERAEFVEKLARWKTVYRAPRNEKAKNFPIRNASNIEVPVAKEFVNTMAAQVVQMTMTAEPRWILKDLADEWDAFAPLIERFLDIAARRDIQIEKSAIPWILECIKYGTSISVVDYEVKERNTFRYDSTGMKVKKKKVTLHDGPVHYHVPLERFWIRFHETDVDDARWCSIQHDMTERDLRDYAAMEKFDKDVVEKIVALRYKNETDVHETERVDEEIEKTQPVTRESFNVHEFFLAWDFDGDGVFEEARIWYNTDTEKVIRKEYLSYWHGKRPIAKLGFFPHEDRFYDEGIIEMVEALQQAISQKHNQRADNATLANLKMIIKRRMLKTLNPGDPLYSGKIIEANDIWNDVREFQLSEIYPSTVNEESILRSYGERLVGHSDATSGGARPVTRTTATAEMALLQEQAKRLDLAVRNIRTGMSRVGWLSMNLYFQYGTNGKALAWMGEKGRIVDAVFRIPRRAVDLGVALETNSPTSTQNKQVQRENSISLFNLMVQMYTELIPLVAQLAPQSMGEVTNALVTSAKKFMGDTLAAFEVSDPEDVLAGLTVLERVLPSPSDLGGMDDFIRREESAQVFDKLARVEALLQEASESSRGNDRVRPGSRRTENVPPGEGGAGGGPSGPGFDFESLGL